MISATVHATDKHLRGETLGAVSFDFKILDSIPKCQKDVCVADYLWRLFLLGQHGSFPLPVLIYVV